MNETEGGYVISALVSMSQRKKAAFYCVRVSFEMELSYQSCGINVCVFYTETLTRDAL